MPAVPSSPAAAEAPVRRRAVFLVGGYERNSGKAFFARVDRDLARFAACWSVTAGLGPIEHDRVEHVSNARIAYRDATHAVATDLAFLSFDDIVRADGARALPVRVGRWLAAFSDFVVTGTMLRFFAANWRFALYFLYPFLALLAAVGLVAGGWWAGQAVPAPAAGPLGALAGLAAALLLLRRLAGRGGQFGRRDRWSFRRDQQRGRRPAMDARVEAWARLIDRRVTGGGYDEVVLVGHSTGGALILDVAAHYAQRLSARGLAPGFTVLTVGSTGPKVTLHPAARAARARLAGLVAHPGVEWADYQALTDIINFYGCDPLALAGIANPRAEAFPVVRRVRFKSMLDKAYYRRMKRNFFRVHYQFISANTRRSRYDFFMLCCGPFRQRAVARGAVDLKAFRPDERSAR